MSPWAPIVAYGVWIVAAIAAAVLLGLAFKFSSRVEDDMNEMRSPHLDDSAIKIYDEYTRREH
jgi:hypothetical protein